MIELTLDQVRALAQAGNPQTVIDPITKTAYALVPLDNHGGVGGGPLGGGVGGGHAPPESPLETPVEPWKHLVIRRHPWRKQLYVKGRNMTVRQLVGGVKANKLTEEQAAKSYELPVEAIREALTYFEANPEVIALDHATEAYLLTQHEGRGRGPDSVPR
jgi:uncharacterized protein (DUF433 family)